MQELMLMNPSKGKRTGSRSFQIVFPKKIKRLRANEGSVGSYAGKKIPFVGITGKHAAGAIGGAAATVVIPKVLKLKGWADVAGSGVTAVVGGGLIRGADKDAGEAFLYAGLGVTGLKAARELINAARGKTSKRKRRSSLGDEDIDKLLDNVDDLSQDDIDRLLSGDVGQDEDIDRLLDIDFLADIVTEEGESKRGTL